MPQKQTRITYRPVFDKREYSANMTIRNQEEFQKLVKAHTSDAYAYLQRTDGNTIIIVKHGELNHRLYHQVPTLIAWCSGEAVELQDVKTVGD